MKQNKITLIVMLGTMLEYYDFLLFAHLGFFITPLFFPFYSPMQTHILSLALFGLSFITRPIGGYIFGLISDKKGRNVALIRSIRWAVFPAMGFAILPDYKDIGIVSAILFVLLRLMQGVALGGEYPVAGTYLMEQGKKNQGFLSAVLMASGSVGSVIGLGMAVLCMHPDAPEWLWRVAFLLGGVGVVISYYMRKYLKGGGVIKAVAPSLEPKDINARRWLIFVVSVTSGAIVWIPMTYSNFYITKILGMPVKTGLYASFIALICFIGILPFCGMVCDRMKIKKYMLWSIALICPMTLMAIYALSKGYIVFAQIGLASAAAIIGAPAHKLFNSIFPIGLRGRNIGLIYMSGLSFGGLLPSISSFVVGETGFYLAPALLISVMAGVSYFFFNKLYNNKMLS